MAIIFEDRKSAYPNRYKITPLSGNSYYAFLERADEPSVVGTPLNAETFNEWAKQFSETGSLPEVTVSDDGKILCVKDGSWTAATIENSPVATFIGKYISSALGGDY